MATSLPPASSTDHPSDHHRLAQTGLALTVSGSLVHAWDVVDVHALRATLPRLKELVAGLVHRYAPASATLSVQHYEAARNAAGVRTPFRPTAAHVPPLEQIGRTVDWAAQPLWGSQPDMATAQTRLEGAVEKLVLDVGRETTVENVQRDRMARAWAREAKPGACYFCSLLATRGAVYKTSATAGDESNRFHDHCRCVVVPVFGVYEPTAQARQWQQEHADLKKEFGGVSMNLWRQHVEGRLFR
jgi:hypothetical protein